MRLIKFPKWGIALGVAVQLGRLVCHSTERALVKALMDDVSRSSAVAAKGFQEPELN